MTITAASFLSGAVAVMVLGILWSRPGNCTVQSADDGALAAGKLAENKKLKEYK